MHAARFLEPSTSNAPSPDFDVDVAAFFTLEQQLAHRSAIVRLIEVAALTGITHRSQPETYTLINDLEDAIGVMSSKVFDFYLYVSFQWIRRMAHHVAEIEPSDR